MVVIIDDRADVWEWSPNLIKVIPCEVSLTSPGRYKLTFVKDDFFVGIGDINSAFLPKIEPLAPTVHTPTLGQFPCETLSATTLFMIIRQTDRSPGINDVSSTVPFTISARSA